MILACMIILLATKWFWLAQILLPCFHTNFLHEGLELWDYVKWIFFTKLDPNYNKFFFEGYLKETNGYYYLRLEMSWAEYKLVNLDSLRINLAWNLTRVCYNLFFQFNLSLIKVHKQLDSTRIKWKRLKKLNKKPKF